MNKSSVLPPPLPGSPLLDVGELARFANLLVFAKATVDGFFVGNPGRRGFHQEARAVAVNEFQVARLNCRNIADKWTEIRAENHKAQLAETPRRGFNAHAYGNTHETGTRSHD